MEHVADHLNVHMHRCYAHPGYVCILYHNSSIIIAARRRPLTLRWVKKWVVMWCLHQWKYNTIARHHKTVIWQLIGWWTYYAFFVIVLEVSDITTDGGVRIGAVDLLLTNIHVSVVKWHDATMVRSVSVDCSLLIPFRASWSSENTAPRSTFSKTGSYHHCSISVIFLHTFAKYLIALTFSASLGSWTAYRICIEIITAIVLHPHKSLLRWVPDIWLWHFVKCMAYLNCGFYIDTDPATISQGARTRNSTNEWDMTAEHDFSYLCDEFRHSVDESGRLFCFIHTVFTLIGVWQSPKPPAAFMRASQVTAHPPATHRPLWQRKIN